MKRCKKCFLPDTKPDLWFNEEGMCAACIAYSNRRKIDWESQRRKLITLLLNSREQSGSQWDCVVPVSGGKDSTFQALTIRSLGFNPLCVVSTTCDLSAIGLENIRNLNSLGFDMIEFSPNPIVRRKLNKIGLETVGDISWPEHVGIFTIPVKVAVNFGIPLLIWGENSQNEYGGPQSSQESQVLNREWLEEFGGLLGMRVSDLVATFGFQRHEIEPYSYPEPEELESNNTTGIFLGQFVPWDGFTNVLLAQNYGFRTFEKVIEGSFVNYENLDNLQAGIHDYFKYLKFGFGRVSDLASIHIRRGRISREIAKEIIKERDGMYPSSYLGVGLKEILERVGITTNDFDSICDRFTNPTLFERDSQNNFIRREDGSPKLITPVV